ncbi:LPXTG cell wall anchor domain-containing protein [Enterococcus hulanensis]|uniref:LPXTG cell wall anchor domain-containing protein n=1 Tax=Enterococcus hulanensis TaxID=2559929 RepID=UPI0010F92DC5|nr:LPXTG cell wall anchor domain-containing protein [Enterococcus hulanensis]
MKKKKIWPFIGVLTLVIPLLFGVLPEKTEAAGAVYYVNAESGNDTNEGTSPDQAWATLDKIEKTKFEPGDTIRLHEASVFDDTLVLEGDKNGEGADGAPIILESYGDTGGKATINGNGKGYVDQMEKKDIYSTVTLFNASHWTIRDLAITNIGPGEDTNEMSKKDRVGMYVLAKNNGLTQDIHVDNLDVSDVNGSWNAKDIGNGGIFFTVTGTPTGEVTRFHNISVTNCQVDNVTRTGISVGATVYGDIITPDTEATTIEAGVIQQYGHTDVLIENNYVKQSGGDAIVPQFCYKPLIQYNVSDTASFSHSKWDLTSKENGTWQVNAGIWPWLCYFPNFQYNEAFNTVDNYDGEAYDCDSGTGTIYQYNYSHDNEGGFMLICSPKNFDSLIRYNISQNDRKHLFLVSNSLNPDYYDPRYPGISEEETAYVYNNTLYTGPGLDVTVMSQEEPGYVRMKNNLFYNEGINVTPYWQPAHYGKEHPATVKYDHNLYYGYTNLPNNEENPTIVKNPSVELTGAYNSITLPEEPQHERGIKEDEAVEGEVMTAPGTGGIGLDSVAGYQLTSSSPAINAGTAIVDNGGHDYFGNALTDGQTDIGAHEYAGEITPPTSSTEESSSTEPSSSSTEESSSTKPSSSSTEESSSTKPTSSSTEESSSTEPSSSSTEESSSTKPSSSSTEESSSTKPTSSSTEESSSTKPSSSSTEESSSTKPSSSSTEESSSTKPSSSSTEESSSTKPSSSSTEESSSTKPTSSSTEESSSTKPTSSSTEESSSTKPTSSSTEESSSTKPSSSTEESSSTKPSSSSTEESSSTKPSSSTEESSSTKPSSSTEESSSTKPSSSSTEESSSTKPSSSVDEGTDSTKPSSSVDEGTDSTKASTSKDSSSSSKEKTSDDSKDDSKKKPTDDSKGNLGGGAQNTPSNRGGSNVTVRNQTVNGASESTKKELPKTGSVTDSLLIWCGITLIIGSAILIRKTNIVRK